MVVLLEGKLTDGRNDSGLQVPSSLYYYRIVAGGQTETRKMMMLK